MVIPSELDILSLSPSASAKANWRRSGWRPSAWLSWQDVKDIVELAHRADYNTVLHIMPIEGTDAERKRAISRIVAHLGQALHRREKQHIGTTVYEKGTADLHGHHMCRVDPEDRSILRRFDGYIVRAEIFTRKYLLQKIFYCTKQRAPLPPSFEQKLRSAAVPHLRQRAAPIPGPRSSHPKAAKNLLLAIDDAKIYVAHLEVPDDDQRIATGTLLS